MNLRNIKEKSLGGAANYLAENQVDPNVVTLVGLLLTLFAESVALTKGVESTSNNESAEEIGSGIFWLATLARMFALLADGLDGSVARARKKIDPRYVNENGSYIDGATDRLVNTIRMMVESFRFEKAGNQSVATLAAATGVASNVPSYLRAETEARGGTTTEQSLSLLKFAGTHAGRTAISLLISLEFSQVDQIVSAITFGRHITPAAWDKVKQFLIGYVAVSTTAVTLDRFEALVSALKHSSTPDAASALSVDSAGFADKNARHHQKRAQLYLAMLVGSTVWAGVTIVTMNLRQRRSLD